MENSDLKEKCGLFGCIASGEWPTGMDVAHIIYLGMIALQHRGQESCGISTSRGGDEHVSIKKPGLVSHAFSEDDLSTLQGNMGIGHTRYSTTGGTEHLNTQPFVVHTMFGKLSVAHNGELVNASELRRDIIEKGVGLSTASDSELIVQILCMPPPELDEKDGPNWPARIQNLMQRTKLAYSLLIMCGEKIYAVRDPFGNRPLCLGMLLSMTGSPIAQDNEDEWDGYVVSSESCAFPSVGARLIREVLPGEIVEITRNGFKSIGIVPRPDDCRSPAFCIFEYVYFARPDSMFQGQSVYEARKECGKQLARQAPVSADIVSAVPESSIPAALGYSEESNIKYVEVFCKNRYVGRTFIQPTVRLRQLAVLQKFGPLSDNFRGKRIILIDDSIVRGTTIGAIISLLREAGASEVHVRIASPPVKYPCYMGINIPTKEELIANKFSDQELPQQIGADSLAYLKVENLLYAVKKNAETNGKSVGHCTACLTGKYPVERALDW